MRIIFCIGRLLALAVPAPGGFTASTLAQEIIIPDPNFNAVIREAVQKPIAKPSSIFERNFIDSAPLDLAA